MYQRDYLMRMIEQMTEALGNQVFQLKKEKKLEEALDLIDDLFHRQSLPHPKLIESLPVDELAPLFTFRGRLETEKAVAAAMLLRERAELDLQQNENESAYRSGIRALLLFLLAERAEGYDAGLSNDIERTAFLLRDYELPNGVLAELSIHYERTGRFDQAENMLFRRLDGGDSTAIEEGLRFYERLIGLQDDALVSGGLPRVEVEEGMEALRSRSR